MAYENEVARFVDAIDSLSMTLASRFGYPIARTLGTAWPSGFMLVGWRSSAWPYQRCADDGGNADRGRGAESGLVSSVVEPDENLIRPAYGSEDFREGVSAFVAKRKPTWKDR